ncbi:MAG: ADP-ribosylglycohydrolase family protein [Shewanella sp.]|jgi:ADP-ribosyl-[dinitrogen reductase] hydrolase|nr:ADP-ribosylglycohydrolase family protein [Shewanella sp.]
MNSLQDKYEGCLLGLACGDAVGTTVEFKRRGSFAPITDMVGGGPFNLVAGQWTDDTSMALCLAESLLAQKGFDAKDQMDRYLRWYNDGYMSSKGYCFDIGLTISGALKNYSLHQNPYAGSTHPRTAGNGSIMRLAPIPLYYLLSLEQTIHFAGESSRTTHGSEEAVESAKLFAVLIRMALLGHDKQEILFKNEYYSNTATVNALAQGDYLVKEEKHIKGSGYVIESLEAALWCFARTDSFEQAVLKAVNLGDDADTTAAIVGQIAGAYYGVSAIPSSWLKKLYNVEFIRGLAVSFFSNQET